MYYKELYEVLILSNFEDLQSRYENIIIKSFPYFLNYEYELKMIKFYKLSSLEFHFKNGALFKFNIEDDKIICFNLFINKGNLSEILEFCKNLECPMVKNSLSFFNIINVEEIEFKYEVDNKNRTINAIFLNEKYKIMLEKEQYIFKKNSYEDIKSRITIYSIKDKNHLVEEYKLCEINNFNDFLDNIQFNVNSVFKKMLSEMISNVEFSDFENLMDYYFEEIKKVKTLNNMMNY